MNNFKNFLALLTAGIIYGSFGVWIRFLSRELSPYQQVFLRNIIGFILALIVVFLLKQRINLKTVNKTHLLLYAVSFPLAQVFYTLAMLNTSLGITTFAFYAASFIFSFFVGKLLFSDEISRVKVASLFLAFLGIIILSYKSLLSGLINFGFVFGFLGGVFDATTNTFRRFLAGKVQRFILVSIQMMGGTTVAVLFLFFYHQALPTSFSLDTLSVAVLFGLLLVGLNFLLNYGFQNFDLNLGTILLSTELVSAPIFGLLIFKEIPSQTDIIGGLFILSAVLLANTPHFLLRKQRT